MSKRYNDDLHEQQTGSAKKLFESHGGERDEPNKKLKLNIITSKKIPPSMQKKGIQIKLSSQKESAQPVLKTPSKAVASAFGDESDEEPEEMPPEARMRMRNIGRDTPTSAGPNSYGKTKHGFCNAKKVFEKNLKEAALELSNDPPSQKTKTVDQQKSALPISKVKNDLMKIIQDNQTIIIVGETGCGKTTQIPQYLYECSSQESGIIAITQPRRVAVLTISQRVAQEMKSKLGELVGYNIRFENCTSSETKIKYLTDGMLLRESISDELFMNYSTIILDEVHERTLNNDILFGLVKFAQAKRAEQACPLRIIIMSATMDVDHIQAYFESESTSKIPVVYLEGRLHPIDIFYNTEESSDYVHDILVTIFQIHEIAPAKHDILVFLTGQEEIEFVASSIRRLSKDKSIQGPGIIVCCLYASLSSAVQMDTFKPTPDGMRKIVLSTNIAETSVTISGIKYVIDSGKVKMKCHDSTSGLDMLKVITISQAQACQRAGRAGRESSGSCYRIYRKKVYEENMEKFPIPEILRCNLSSSVLQLLSVKINPFVFNFIDNPDDTDLDETVTELDELGAVIRKPNLCLTETGYRMSTLPLDSKLAKILISAPLYNCVSEALTVVSILSGDPIFINPSASAREDICTRRQIFHSSMGDHVTFLNVFNSFKAVKDKKKEWCSMNYLSFRNLEYATKVREQLINWCHRFGISVTSCGEDLDSLCKCILTGLFRNVAILCDTKTYITISSKHKAKIHPSSVLSQSLPSCLVYTEIIDSSQTYLKTITVINPDWLPDVIPDEKRYQCLRKTSQLKQCSE